jgi:hypothetical protein
MHTYKIKREYIKAAHTQKKRKNQMALPVMLSLSALGAVVVHVARTVLLLLPQHVI